MSKRKKNKEYKKRIKKQREEHRQNDVSEKMLSNNIVQSEEDGYFFIDLLFGRVELVLAYFGLIYGIAEAIVQSISGDHLMINIFALFGALCYFPLLFSKAILMFVGGEENHKSFASSLSLLCISCLCVLSAGEIDSVRFAVFSVVINFVSVFVSTLTLRASRKKNKIERAKIKQTNLKQTNLKQTKEIKSEEIKPEEKLLSTARVRDIILMLILTGISTFFSGILCIRYGSWFSDEKLIDISEVSGLLSLSGYLAIIVLVVGGCNCIAFKNILSMKNACINDVYSSCLTIIAILIAMIVKDDEVGMIIAIAYFLAFTGYANALFRYLAELYRKIKQYASRINGKLDKTDASIKKEKNPDFVYENEFELEVDILVSAYKCLRDEGRLDSFSGIDITFEPVGDYQTKMKCRKRRPALYNITNSLSKIYDKKLEQKISDELLTAIRSKIYVY